MEGKFQRASSDNRLYRWLVLIVISIAMFGNYYLYDSIAPVADLLKSQLNFSQSKIGQLNMFYSIAAIGVLTFSGVFIDKFGTRISILLFGTLCTIAGILTMISHQFHVMLLGRIILGIGAEPLVVAATVAIAKWFKGKEIAFALGINLMIARFGSFFANKAPSIFENRFLVWKEPLKIAAIIGMLCLLAGIIYYFQEGYGQKKYKLGKAEKTDKLSLKGFFLYNRSFWLIILLCFTFYSAIFPFYSTFSFLYLTEFHGLDRSAAGNLLVFLPVFAMFATPLIGLLVDLIGKRASLMTLGSILIMPVFIIMSYTSLNLRIPLAMLGFSFSLIPAIMWPSVAYVVKEHKLGKGYALMTLLQQVGVAGFNWLIGYQNDIFGASPENPQGYLPMVFTLSTLGILGLIFSIWLLKIEKGPKGHGLELPSKVKLT
ncbi:MAG: MFS transporter [Bacteroidales bacterium]|nr:MFS transporter [Bacteroidales bacterium]